MTRTTITVAHVPTADAGHRLQGDLVRAIARGDAQLLDGVDVLEVVPHWASLAGLDVVFVDGTPIAEALTNPPVRRSALQRTFTRTHVYDVAPCGHRTPIPNEAYADWIGVTCDQGDEHAVTVELVDGVPTSRWRPIGDDE